MDYTSEFEEFWLKYPSRWEKDSGSRIKRKKRPAFIKWQKLSAEIQAECLAKVKYVRRHEGAYVRDCVTWLNQYGWEDIDIKPKPKPIVSKSEADGIIKSLPDEPELDTKKINKALKENRK